MTPKLRKKRREMIEGTNVLWSTLTYVPVLVCAAIALTLTGPILSPLEQTSQPLPNSWVFGLSLFLAIGAPMVLWFCVWHPLKQLARNCGTAQIMRAHCLNIARLSLPYVPLMAIPFVLICYHFGYQFLVFQMGAVLLVEHAVEKWRKKPIEHAVDQVLGTA